MKGKKSQIPWSELGKQNAHLLSSLSVMIRLGLEDKGN